MEEDYQFDSEVEDLTSGYAYERMDMAMDPNEFSDMDDPHNPADDLIEAGEAYASDITD